MKKHLQYLWAALFAVAALPAAAQTQADPLELVVGENTVPATDDFEAFYKYTPTENVTVYLDGLYISSYYNYRPYYLNEEGLMEYVASAGNSYPTRFTAFNAQKGTTYYFAVSGDYDFTFTCTVTRLEGSATGTTCDDPIVMPEDGKFLYPVNGNTFTYAKFVAPISGRFVMSPDSGFQSLYVGTSCDEIETYIDYNFEGGSYKYEYTVEEGETYYFMAKGWSAVYAGVEVEEMIPGSTCKDAWEAVEGENTIPAAAGTYWYKTVAAPKECMLVMSSDAKVSVEIASGCGYNGMTYEEPNLRYGILSVNATRVIKIVKAEATAADETFKIEFDDLLPIEDDEVGEPIVLGEEMTTPSASSYYYYSLTTPAGDPKLCVVDFTSSSTDQYNPAIDVKVLGEWGRKASGNNTFQFQAEPNTTYMFTVNVRDEAITFKVDLKELEAGSLSTYPIQAVVGDNELPAFSPVYYSYEEKEGSKMQVTTDIEGATIDVSIVGDQWTTVDFKAIDNGFIFMPEAGVNYLLTVTKPEGSDAAAGNLTLKQLPFEAGEAWQTAIEVEAGVTNLPAAPFDVWYKITAAQSGFLTIDLDMPFVYNNKANIYVGAVSGNPKTVDTTYDYQTYESYYKATEVGVEEGTVVYINLKNSQGENSTVTFGYKEALPGQTFGTAIPVLYKEKGEVTEQEVSGTLGYNTYMWYTMDLPAGVLDITCDNVFTINLYSADDLNTPIKAFTSYSATPGAGIKGVEVKEGKYYFTVSNTSNYAADAPEVITLNILVRDPLPGESADLPVVLDQSVLPVAVAYPALNDNNFWIQMELVPGKLTILSNPGQSNYAYLYNANDLKKEVAEGKPYFSEELQAYQYGLQDFEVTEAGTYFYCIYYASEAGENTFSGSALEEPELVFPTELNVSLNVEGLNITQEYDEEEGSLMIQIDGATRSKNVVATLEVPAGWDGFIGANMGPAGFALEGPTVAEVTEEFEAQGATVVTGNEFTFNAEARSEAYMIYLVKGDVVNVQQGILLGAMLDYIEEFPEFPTELNITSDVEGLEIEQDFDAEDNILMVQVMGNSPVRTVNMTFEVPAEWDSFIGIPAQAQGFALEGTPVDEFEEYMEMDGIEVLKGNEFSFTADSRMHLYNFWLVKDDVIYEDAGIMFGFMVDCDKSDVAVNVEVEEGASFSFNVPFDAATGFSLALPADFVVEAATLNGEDIEVADKYEFTVGETDMNYVFTVAYDGDIKFVDATVGVVEVGNNLKVSVVDGKVRIEGTEAGDVVTVYTVGGMTVGNHTASNEAIEIALPAGVYVVRVNNTAVKVRI